MLHKNLLVASLTMVTLALSGCAQALSGGGQARPGAFSPGPPTVEPKGPAASPTSALAEGTAPASTIAAGVETMPPETLPTAAPSGPPTVNPALANVQLPTAADLEQRWRQMQVDRTAFEAPRSFVSSGFEIVWWFDPVFGQVVPIGDLRGEFTAQAEFRIKGQWIGALEIPYRVNQQYGITVPEPILQRMQNAGKGEWAEVFVYRTRDVQEK